MPSRILVVFFLGSGLTLQKIPHILLRYYIFAMDSAITFEMPEIQSLLAQLTESELMDFIEIWADQRGSICQRLNGAKLTGASFGPGGGLQVLSTWHVWEKEELSELRGGWFQHSKTIDVQVLIPFGKLVSSLPELQEALASMRKTARDRGSPFSPPVLT
jgi:hypothetical protein